MSLYEIDLEREQRREALAACKKQLQEQMSEQLQLLQHINRQSDYRSWYVHGCVMLWVLFYFFLGLGIGISNMTCCEEKKHDY